MSSSAIDPIDRAENARARLLNAVSSGKKLNEPALQFGRLHASHTLLRVPSEVQAWNAACQLVATWLAEKKALSFDALVQLNRVVRNIDPHQPAVRSGPIFVEEVECPSVDRIPELVAQFDDGLTRINVLHPVEQAAWVMQHVVSIHPFSDANGRTARLASDWVLARAGFPPMVFLSPIAFRVLRPIEHVAHRPDAHAIAGIAMGLETASQFLLHE